MKKTCDELKRSLVNVMDEFVRLSGVLRLIKAELRRLWWVLVVTIDPVERERIIAQREALSQKAAHVGKELQECWDRRQEIRRQMAAQGCK